MNDNQKSGIGKLLEKIILWGGVLSALCWLVTLVWGFSWGSLVGFFIGYVYMCLCYVYLGKTCENAVLYDKRKAKRSMLACYVIRYLGLFGLCAFAMLTKAVNVVGVLVPQFFPRIILTVLQFSDRKEKSDE